MAETSGNGETVWFNLNGEKRFEDLSLFMQKEMREFRTFCEGLRGQTREAVQAALQGHGFSQPSSEHHATSLQGRVIISIPTSDGPAVERSYNIHD